MPTTRKFLFSALSISLCAAAFAQNGRLEFADRVRLVSCNPSTSKPCFRLKFNVVDQQGSPLSLNLRPDQDIHPQMKVLVDGATQSPFFAVSRSAGSHTIRGRVTLILVDISGSMNIKLASGKTRFQTAQQALQGFLRDFDPSVDQIAVVPFESHNVAATINAAQFTRSKEEATAQIQALTAPQSRNNTGLYSAVVLGLEALARQVSNISGAAPESLLVVMTDGKNEVYRGDDPGLLAGPTGLEEAARAVHSSGTEVIGIGFGDPGSIDGNALTRISTKFYAAQDLSGLEQVFSFARSLLVNRVVATVESLWPDRSSLEGRSVRFSAKLDLPDGRHFESDEKTWEAPQMGIPTFEGQCDSQELSAALQVPPVEGSWFTLLRPVLVFVGLGTALLVLWFWVPRLVWPEQYIGSFVTQRGRNVRWSDKTQFQSAGNMRPTRPAPPGFETRKHGSQPPRAPADRTVVQPDFSKSRLQRPSDR